MKVLFEGKPVQAFGGEPIAVSLHRYGVRTFSRSLKYRKSRGLLCMSGACAQCMVNVDGIPNVRACITPAKDGMTIKRQRGWPSTEHDLVSFFLGLREVEAGFQYKAGITFWPVFMWAYTRLTGAGTLEFRDVPKVDYTYQATDRDVVIVGAGPAGLGAAFELRQTPLRFTLIEQMPWLGGDQALLRGAGATLTSGQEKTYSVESIDGLVDAESKMTNTTVIGFYRPNTILATRNYNELFQFKAQKFILATGAYEDLPIIENADVPGFYSFRGALIMVNGYGTKLGERGVVVGEGDRADIVRRELEKAGMKVTSVPTKDVVRITGARRATGVVVRDNTGSTKTVSCDFVVAAAGVNPKCELPYQSGAQIVYDEADQNYVTTHDDTMRSTDLVYVAGSMCGSKSHEESFRQGRIAGLAVAHSLTKESKYRSKLLKLRDGGDMAA